MELLTCWKVGFGQSMNWVIWQVVPHCLFWYPWRERNDNFFRGRECQLPNLKGIVLRTLLDLMDATILFTFSNILDLLDLCIV
jgi:hypothetical protein